MHENFGKRQVGFLTKIDGSLLLKPNQKEIGISFASLPHEAGGCGRIRFPCNEDPDQRGPDQLVQKDSAWARESMPPARFLALNPFCNSNRVAE